jgi:hypothetical protein
MKFEINPVIPRTKSVSTVSVSTVLTLSARLTVSVLVAILGEEVVLSGSKNAKQKMCART